MIKIKIYKNFKNIKIQQITLNGNKYIALLKEVNIIVNNNCKQIIIMKLVNIEHYNKVSKRKVCK